MPKGQSSVIGDAHRSDQLEPWRAGKTRACCFERSEVVAHAVSTTVLAAGFPAR